MTADSNTNNSKNKRCRAKTAMLSGVNKSTVLPRVAVNNSRGLFQGNLLTNQFLSRWVGLVQVRVYSNYGWGRGRKFLGPGSGSSSDSVRTRGSALFLSSSFSQNQQKKSTNFWAKIYGVFFLGGGRVTHTEKKSLASVSGPAHTHPYKDLRAPKSSLSLSLKRGGA